SIDSVPDISMQTLRESGVDFSGKDFSDEAAHKWLVKRNPDSWSRAFFEMDRDTAAFENGISESFNSMILKARCKPLITMLEDIRIYLMQSVYYMNKQAMMLEDTITPSIRSGFQEVEVRKAYAAFCVNLHTKRCLCRKWKMSGIPCVHAVAGYLHMKMDPELGVSQSYSKNKWIEAYQYGIRPVLGSKTWMSISFPKPLPPLERKMPGRP
nr:hypothetical protein CTI12_AA091940 [Tanacetum cinerariifolium]